MLRLVSRRLELRSVVSVARGVLGCLRSPLAPQVFGVLGVSWSELCVCILDALLCVCSVSAVGYLLVSVEREFLGVFEPASTVLWLSFRSFVVGVFGREFW